MAVRPSFLAAPTQHLSVLRSEPVSECVDTNLTIDYTLKDSTVTTNQVNNYNLTDRGGFYNLTKEYPTFNRDGQNIDLRQHAYKGAVLSNLYTLMNLGNITRNESYAGSSVLQSFNSRPLSYAQAECSRSISPKPNSSGAKLNRSICCTWVPSMWTIQLSPGET